MLQTDFGQKYLGGAPPLPVNMPVRFNNFIPYTDVTKGSLIGVYDGQGANLDNLGIILALPEDTEYEYSNVRYDLSAFKVVGERMLSLKEGIVKNPSSATVAQQLSFSHIDVPYSADLLVRRSDGSTNSIKNFSGVYRGVNVSRFTVDTEDIPT